MSFKSKSISKYRNYVCYGCQKQGHIWNLCQGECRLRVKKYLVLQMVIRKCLFIVIVMMIFKIFLLLNQVKGLMIIWVVLIILYLINIGALQMIVFKLEWYYRVKIRLEKMWELDSYASGLGCTNLGTQSILGRRCTNLMKHIALNVLTLVNSGAIVLCTL